jgi:long-chain acyl-CoA synthetase
MTEFNISEVHHIIRHSEAKGIFVSAKLYDKIEECENHSLELRILIDDFTIIPSNVKKDRIKEVLEGGLREFSKIKAAAKKFVGIQPSAVKEGDLAVIIYTSGTTGHSKGVMLTHRNLIFDAGIAHNIVHPTKDDRFLSILPLSHTYECTLGLLAPIMAGSSVYYLDKPPTAAVLLPALSKVRPTIILSVPLIIEKIYKAKVLPELKKKKIVRGLSKFPMIRKKIHRIAGKKLLKTFGGKLRVFAIGGAALAPDVEKFLKEAGFPYAIGYGLTETSPLVSGTDPTATKLRSVGKVFEKLEAKIDKPDKKTGEGEVLIRGDVVMQGYYKDKERTREVLSKDGWFSTGDLGYIDKDNFLYIRGRSKNVIIGSSGKNIYPEEIESVLTELEYCMEALVYETNGKLYAKVYLNYDDIDNDFDINMQDESEARKIVSNILKDLKEQVNERVASFSKISQIHEQAEPFEKTPTKKIKRYLYV